MLARLGHGAAADEDIAELAGFFSVKTKGLLRRSRAIEIERPKTPAQWQRRKALLDGTDLTSFAGALGLAPQDLIAAWDWNVRPGGRRGTDQVDRGDRHRCAACAGRRNRQRARCDRPHRGARPAACPRRAGEVRSERLARARHGLRDGAGDRGSSRAAGRSIVGAGRAKLLAGLRREDANPSDHSAAFYALGLLVSRMAAQQTLQRLTGAGLLQGDPRLDMLRLNAALDDNGEKP